MILKEIKNETTNAVICFSGGRLLIGVADDCTVYGIPCNRSQEDLLRRQIDCVIGKFHPPVFPNMYSIRFIPVIPNKESNFTADTENLLKVLQIKIEPVVGAKRRLYETDKGEVYVRRDGSVQGPLKASQIIDWFTFHSAHEDEQVLTVEKPEAKITEVIGKKDFGTKMTKVEKQTSTYSLCKLNEIETTMRERQKCIEREITLMRGYYKSRKKALQAELKKLKCKLKKTKKSKFCLIF